MLMESMLSFFLQLPRQILPGTVRLIYLAENLDAALYPTSASGDVVLVDTGTSGTTAFIFGCVRTNYLFTMLLRSRFFLFFCSRGSGRYTGL